MASTVRKKSVEKNAVVDEKLQARYFCCRCGKAFSRQKGFFPVSHSPMYRAAGYLPWCNDCIEDMYDEYRTQYENDRDAMRRICMKMDLYWCDAIYDIVEKTAGVNSRIRTYIGKTNIVRYIDKTYDDTISDDLEKGEAEAAKAFTKKVEPTADPETAGEIPEVVIDVPDEVRLFWGPGYTDQMYVELEERRKYWMSRFPSGYETDIGEEALIRQICNLEIDINHDRAAGKAIDKSVNTLNTLLGSLNIKPTQKKEEVDSSVANTPLGVWLYRYENKRPLPEVDDDLKDVNGLKKYIFTWMGHLCKMLGKKNGFTRLYEEEIARLRVNRPEYSEEDDETLLYDAYTEDSGDEL